MAEGGAKKDVQVSVGKDLIVIGTDRVEVSPDGKRVTAYTNVETKAASGEAPAQGISISADFNTVVLNGATIERAPDGRLVISTPSIVITKPGPANDTAAKAKATPQIGDRMPAGHPNAGWLYAGVSKSTNQPLYVAPKDSGVFQWKAAMDVAAMESARVPSREELNQIYDARDEGALKGTFNVTGLYPAGWYWSSSQGCDLKARVQRFSDGNPFSNGGKLSVSSLRCVR